MTEAPTLSEIAAREVRGELARQRRSLVSLAAELGVSDMWLGRRLNGQTKFDLDELELVAAALGVPVVKFLCIEAAA